MRINVFGMGYVGCVSAACMANLGHVVIGVEVDAQKVDSVSSGISPFVEPGLDLEIQKALKSGRLVARRNDVGNVPAAEMSLVCVGTPSRENGSLGIEALERVSEQIGTLIARSEDYHVVNVRSTVLPGVIEDVVVPRLETTSGKRSGRGFGVCMNPEFLREGTAIRDFYDPPFTVVGELDAKSGDVVCGAYAGVKAPLIRTSIRTAEMVKYASNSFHALKISFANEIGNLCKRLGVNSYEVMDLFCRDTKLNISAAYLKPGFAFGGSCLPKDLRAILYKAKQMDLTLPLLSAILTSNRLQIDHAFELIHRTGKTRVGVLGISFKPGTDDLRESPMVELVERMIGKGYQVSIFDEEVRLTRLHGANKCYVETIIPHIATIMKEDPVDVVRNAEVIVLGRRLGQERLIAEMRTGKVVVDLVRAFDRDDVTDHQYEGLAW